MTTLDWRELASTRELVLTWAARSVRVRYQQSVLGGLWAVLQPAATVVIFSIIFTYFVPVDTGGIPYVLFSYVAMVPWTFFSASITDMTDSLVSNMNLVSKIYFPRTMLPVAALLARMVDFGIAACLIVVLIIIYRWPVNVAGLLFIPAILAVQLALALGLGFIGAALNVFYRDVRHVITLALQLWFYATPIIYPVSTVPERFRPYYFMNPMAGVIEAFRDVILYQRLPVVYLAISGGVALVVLIAGYLFFRRVEFQFADVV